MSRPTLRLVLLGVLAFAIALVTLWPAQWLAPALPAGMRCATWAGSLWRGQCTGLQWNTTGTAPLNLETLQWRVKPVALLRGQLQADLDVAHALLRAQARITTGIRGRLQVERLNGTGALDHQLLAALPAGWNVRAELKDGGFEYNRGKLQALGGAIMVRELRDQHGANLGDYQLQFTPQTAAPFRGQLRDLAGPLQIAATITISADRSWQLDGTASVRAGSPPVLSRMLDQLGSADLNGQRRISIAGTMD